MSMPHSLHVGAPSCALLGELRVNRHLGNAIGIAGTVGEGAWLPSERWQHDPRRPLISADTSAQQCDAGGGSCCQRSMAATLPSPTVPADADGIAQMAINSHSPEQRT